MKVLVILFGAMLVLMEFQKASAATLLEDFDGMIKQNKFDSILREIYWSRMANVPFCV